MNVRFGADALNDLDTIFVRVAKDDQRAAARLVARFEYAAATIGTFSQIGNKTDRQNIRTFPVGNYLLIYQTQSHEVLILQVRHSARLWSLEE